MLKTQLIPWKLIWKSLELNFGQLNLKIDRVRVLNIIDTGAWNLQRIHSIQTLGRKFLWLSLKSAILILIFEN